ncbi:MAG: hypothetical protein ACOY31_07155 [Bacillota bacterium]
MSPELYQLHAFLEKLKTKNVPQLIEACFSKLRSLEMSSAPDHNLGNNLKSLVLLLKHLKRPADMSPEVMEYLRRYLTDMVEVDRRAKHALDILPKE